MLSSIDLSVCNDLGPCRLSNNNLEEIIMPSEGVAPKTTLDVKNNRLKISTLPKKTEGMSSASRLTYAPQAPYVLPKDITAGTVVDLSFFWLLSVVIKTSSESPEPTVSATCNQPVVSAISTFQSILV